MQSASLHGFQCFLGYAAVLLQHSAMRNGERSASKCRHADELALFSNYSPIRVHLAAPGVDILSTYGSSYDYMSGTSMATPIVSGKGRGEVAKSQSRPLLRVA